MLNEKSQFSTGTRLGLYSALVLFAAVSGFIYNARTSGIFACQAPRAGSDQYIGICNVTNYGDYDHGAFWFGLESIAEEAATKATVLFIGNSRMQFGLSTGVLDDWFRSQSLDYYLLGFSHNDNHLFLGPLIQKLKPTAQMYILNVDLFFDNKLSDPANSVMNDAESLNRYKQKLYWQKIHKRICGKIGSVCGNGSSFVRTRANGSWIFNGADFLNRVDFSDQLVSYDWSVDQDIVASYESRAKDFLAAFTADANCVVLTNIPNSYTSIGTVNALAERLGLPLVAPEIEGLTTFDGSHLDPDSAARWSGVFIEELKPHVQRCLKGFPG